MKKYLLILFSQLLSLVLFPGPLVSQENQKISPYNQLQYFKNTDEQAYLQSTLTYSKDRMELPLQGMVISFFTGEAEKKVLASVMTDENGVAKVILDRNIRLPVSIDGLWHFSSEFRGNDTVETVTSDLAIRDMNLVMKLSQVDSVRNITLKAWSPQNGKEIPVSGEVAAVYVTRMFSLLPVGEATFDEDGNATIEFPPDIPGDKEGNITIIARMEEHPLYGNIEKRITEKWGIPTSYIVPKTHRALWTKTPPMWMIITLSILLTGVWGHYFFAIISLILIKIDSRRKKAGEEYKLKM